MINDLKLRGRSEDTIKNMVCTIKTFSRFYDKAPELLGEHEIINYLEYFIKTKKLSKNDYIKSLQVHDGLTKKNIGNYPLIIINCQTRN